MPTYQCPKCSRTVDLPEGTYSCKVCGISMKPVEAEAIALPASERLTSETIGELMRGMSEASRLGDWGRYNALKDQLNELTRSAMQEEEQFLEERETIRDGVKVWDERHSDPFESGSIRKRLLLAHNIPSHNAMTPHSIQVYTDLRTNKAEAEKVITQLLRSFREYAAKYEFALSREDFNLKHPGEGGTIYNKPIAVEISNYGGSLLVDERFTRLSPFQHIIDGR